MRFLNEQTNMKIDRLILYLTRDEAQEMVDGILDLLKNSHKQHVHISAEDYQKELTCAIYDVKDLTNFDERSQKLILQDK